MRLEPQDGRRALERAGRLHDRIGAWARAACGWHEAQTAQGRPLRRQHAPGRRHRGRQGRGAAPARRLGERLRRRRAGRRGARRPRRRGRPSSSTSTRRRTSSPRRCGAAATGASRSATRRGSRRACAGFLEAGASRRSPTPSRISTACRSFPGIAVQRLMADGYGFGGEGDWKTAALVRIDQGDGRRARRRHVVHGGLHVPPRARRSRRSSARTCSRSAPRSPAASPPARSTRSRSAARRTPCVSSSPRAPGPAVIVGPARPRRPLPARRERGRRRAAGRGPAAAPGRPGGVGAAAGPRRPRRRPGCSPAALTTPCFTQALGVEALADFAEIAGLELLLIDERTR